MANEVVYNGYAFGPYSHVNVSAEMVPDDADRTVLYHRYKIRVETTIVAEAQDAYVGEHFRRIRQLLSKAGQALTIDHQGFGPRLDINNGSPGFGGVFDVAFGPKPKILSWEPVGATNAVEVTWECEFNLPTCAGAGGVRFTGLMAFNYSVSYRIDRGGYSTRTITGYLRIAMTRQVGSNAIPDSADAYRDVVIVPKPINYEREWSWNISLDKTRADFTITDTQIKSPNAYPPGIVAIRANHRVGWSRRSLATLPNTIRASITLSPFQARGLAWDVFRNIVKSRMDVTLAQGKRVFLDSLEVEEDIYGDTISFSLGYKIYFGPGESAIGEIFTGTALFLPVSQDWASWSQSLDTVQHNRGTSKLKTNPTDDQIFDLCVTDVLPALPDYQVVPFPAPTTYFKFCNEKPPASHSYLRFEQGVVAAENNPAISQVTVGPDDRTMQPFDVTEVNPKLGVANPAAGIQRFVESAAAGLEFEIIGYAERVGYPIPEPGNLSVGGRALIRLGEGQFRQKFLGRHFCQPVFGASWRQRYVVEQRVEKLDDKDIDLQAFFLAAGFTGP